VTDVTLPRGQSSIAASSLFTASDPDGDTLTTYAFWNSGTGGGHFVLNGIAQAVGQEIDFTAAQLGQLRYQVGSSPDRLWVSVFDGTLWSQGPSDKWSAGFAVNPPADRAPTVTVTDVMHCADVPRQRSRIPAAPLYRRVCRDIGCAALRSRPLRRYS
jgi:hypothetical protein